MKSIMAKKIIILVLIAITIFLIVPVDIFDNDESDKAFNMHSQMEERVIAGIYRDGTASWFIDEGLSAKKELMEVGISEFIFIDGKRNAQDYIKGVQAMVDEKVDGIILCQPYAEQFSYIVNLLDNAGIFYVSTNGTMRDYFGNQYAPSVGVDDYALGHMTGDWMANYTIKNGLTDTEKVGLVFISNTDLPNSDKRKEGQMNRFLEMVPYFDQTRIYNVSFDGTMEDSMIKTTNIFVNKLNISYWLVMSTNDEGAIGAVRSLEQLGMDSKAAVISIGGTLAVGEFKKEYSALKASGYYSSARIGKESAKQLFAKMKGEELDSIETLFNAVIITKDNYQEVVED